MGRPTATTRLQGGPDIDLQRPRRLRSPARFSTASLIPVVLAVLAGTAAYGALAARSATTQVIVAARGIAVGTPVDLGDTRSVRVHASDLSLLRQVLSPGELSARWLAAVPLAAGEPITRSELKAAGSGPALGQMSIPVPVQDAVGGQLAPGDSVDVIIAGASGSSRYVAQGLTVVGVAPQASAGAFGSGSGSYFVVVNVDKGTALRIAGAVASATGQGSESLEVVRSTAEARYGKGRP